MRNRKNQSSKDTNPSGAKVVTGMLQKAVVGQVVSVSFFMRHWLIIISVIGLVIFYIAGNYMMRENREEIDRLEKRLQIVKTERIRVRENYMSRIRESSMTRMIDSLHLDLRIRDNVPYELPKR